LTTTSSDASPPFALSDRRNVLHGDGQFGQSDELPFIALLAALRERASVRHLRMRGTENVRLNGAAPRAVFEDEHRDEVDLFRGNSHAD
jgi:hypothetical protein